MAYQTVNPADNQFTKTYPTRSDANVEAVLQQADAFYHSIRAGGNIEPRLAVLHKLANPIDSWAEELAKIVSRGMGKFTKQSRDEAKLCAQIARYYADNAKSLLALVKRPSEFSDIWVEHHPIGVSTAVEPWNFPYYQLICVPALNLAAGNPVIAKHASIVSHCAGIFAHLVCEAGVPEEAWTNLFISQEQVAKIIADDRVQGVVLTRSGKAGGVVAAQAARHIKKSTLELGGNDVSVVLDDADLERAVKIDVQARLNNAGQVCTATKRSILHENITESFLVKLSEAFRRMKIGDSLDESTTLGPFPSKDALDTLSKQVDEAVKDGAALHLGGKVVAREGNFFEPTILTDIIRDNSAYFEEFSGPVAQIYVVKNDEEVTQLASDSHYGLDGVVFNQDIERVKRMVSAIETGMVYINRLTDTAPELPFGGVRRSGYGREFSDFDIKGSVNQKLVVARR